MIDNLQLMKELNEKYSLKENKIDYRILYKKFSNRFPLNKVNQLLESYKSPIINYFVDVMKENKKESYLENFYSNLSNSKIIKNKFLQKYMLGNEEFGGNFITKRNNYLVLGNIEELRKSNALLTPYHELLHLMTTRIDDSKTIRVGFQINDFAIGINEGITEVLTKRYFGHLDNNDFDAYIHFTWFNDMLVDIIGKSKIERLYFNSNLEGLVGELEKYIPREKVLELIEDIDLLFNSEDELFCLEKQRIYRKKEIDSETISCYYDENKELLDRIYKSFLEINDNKEKKLEINTNFKEKNDIIKEKYDRENELYKDYFISEEDKVIKK